MIPTVILVVIHVSVVIFVRILHGFNQVECVIIARVPFKITVVSNSPSNEKIIAQISQEEI